jgi:hypothetical protein
MFTRKIKAYLKGQFKSGRNNEIKDAKTEQHWVPPLSQVLTTQHGNWNIVLGRKKWRSQGGYKPCPWWAEPEVAVPFIELSKPNN